MKFTRTEKITAIKDELFRLKNSITPFHNRKEVEKINKTVEVFQAILQDYEIEQKRQASLF